MGSFQGHALPGLFFLLIGIRWTYITMDKYFVHLVKYGSSGSFRCKSTFSSNCCPRLPAEGIFKVTGAGLGILAEVVTGMDNGQFTATNNAQHITMYIFFGINGLVDILMHFGLPLPPGSDYFTMTLACFVEGLLFYFHLHGRSHLDIHVHQLLIIAIALSVLACLVEWKHQDNVKSPLFRSFCVSLQGTWFFQVGFILYNPIAGATPWDPHNHQQMMIVTAMFCWHMAAILIVMFTAGFLLYLKYRNNFLKRSSFPDLDLAYEPCMTDGGNMVVFQDSKIHKQGKNGLHFTLEDEDDNF